MFAGKRVLVTGASGKVALPIARTLAAAGNQVFGLARFAEGGGTSAPDAQSRLGELGIVPIAADVGRVDVDTLPDVDYVFHAGAAMITNFREDTGWLFEANAQASGRLMLRYRNAAGFVYCSTGSVYRYQGHRPLREGDPCGEHLGIYSWSKVAGENVVSFVSHQFGVPATIIRIFSTYGPLGGAPAGRLALIVAGEEVPLYPDPPNIFNPIYEDDYVTLGIRALEVAAVPAVTVNWAGSETVSAEDYCTYLGRLVGRGARFRYTDDAYYPLWPDVTRMHQVLGRTQVSWREGMRRMVAALHPEITLQQAEA